MLARHMREDAGIVVFDPPTREPNRRSAPAEGPNEIPSREDPMLTTERTKREERKQRSEEHRAELERLKRRKRLQSRVTMVVAMLALAIVGYVLAARHPRDGEERNGRIWSAAHGHWHDKYGAEVR